MRLRSILLPLAGTVVLMATAGPAWADTSTSSTSSNWSGYAVHGDNAKFTKVVGGWTVPSPTCVRGHATYSATWVGIGGYSSSSDALEQIGTELNCTASGKVRSSAWMELVPAASKSVKIAVSPGNVIAASVTVKGHRVTLVLDNLSTREEYDRTLTAPDVDITSAEWIVEAPSECSSSDSCEVLPLADFGTTSFADARATTTSGDAGAIRDRHWVTTRITLADGFGHPNLVSDALGSSGGSATPSALSASGAGFSVTYADAAQPGGIYDEPRDRALRLGAR